MKDNKKTITKKLLAFTLAFILLMTSLPLNVFAEMENESNSNFIEENAGEVKNPVGIGKNSKEENFEEIEATDLDVDSIKGEKAKESPYQAAKNPDNLVGNEIPDGTINYGPFEETKIFKVSGNMIRNAENRESSAPQWVQNLINPGGTLDPDLVNEGSVKAYKPVVEEDPNIANKWTVKMLVAARDSVKTSKIVLVIDTSGSMKDFGRMKGAKNAANAFVDNVLDGSQSTQIGIVRFASNVSIVSDFTSNKAKLHSAINALSAEGGTFTQAGVKQARTMLAGSGADKKYMVVLSDGVPTFNYKISHPNNYLIDGGPGSHTHEKQTGKQLPENEFLYNESATGSGNSMWKQYERVKIGGGIFPTYEYHYYNSGNCAIAESGFAKAANMRVFTVGLQTDATGSGVLRDIASAPGDFTEVTDVSQLTPVFEQIAAQILKTVNQATVNVNFNTGFQLPDDFDPATAGHSPGSEITVVDGKPKWTMATVATVFDENDPSLKYEYITYTVTINDAILKNNSPENGINPLGQISMTYTDQNGNPQTTDFPETQVTPKLFVLNKVVTNNAGGAAVDSDKREFQFKVEKVVGSGYTYHETIGLRPGEQKIIHNPDKNADYRVYELRTAKVYDENNENPLNFNVTTYYNKFEVTANGDLPTTTGDAPAGDGIGKSITGSILGGTAGKRLNVTFKNWEEEEARAKISIHKIVEQSRGISRQTPPTFTINLKRKAGVVPGMENEHNWDQTVGMNQTVTIPHMMRFTTYIVTEKDLASILPYAPKLGEQGKEVEITLYKVTAGGALGQVIDFTNVYNSSATVNVTATKTWENGPDADHTAPVFELYADGNKVEGVTPTIVPSSGTATSFTYTWTVQAINATTHLPIEYTVKEAGVGADNKITVNNHIYTVSQHGNEITNTYEIPNNGTFTATKVWSGDEKVTRPTMNFELWRRIGNAAGEQVPGAEVKEINGSITTATWTGLETTTAAGDEYTFYVKESLKNPGDVNNDNWILGEFNTQNNSITNTVKTGDENLGKLTVAKKLLETGNGVRALRGTPIKFSFKVTGPANYEETFELAPGESKVLTGLYFGEYKVEETNTQGYTATYSVADGKVTLKATEKEKTVEVINTSGGQGTVVEKTLEKVWVNGPKPTVTIELWRKNNVEGADKIDEKVDEFIVPANANGNDLKKTFTNLAKHDPKGNEFEYYAKEENVPANYTKA
ncbi:VWA domain-containing protein, partial [Peptoniphilus sp. oral taxon 386]|uniref:VWA domain-containing protein n=1 Tax=Peptoniphilus sp. oral taxon 386 TaxID=652713 RepID=UPI000587137A